MEKQDLVTWSSVIESLNKAMQRGSQMGSYTIDQIGEDFDKTMGEVGRTPITEIMADIACIMIKTLPDNTSRDLAISNLLYSASFVKHCILLEAAKKE